MYEHFNDPDAARKYLQQIKHHPISKRQILVETALESANIHGNKEVIEIYQKYINKMEPSIEWIEIYDPPGLLGENEFYVYGSKHCPFTNKAVALLSSEGKQFRIYNTDIFGRDSVEKPTNFKTIPIIYFGKDFIGGYDDLKKYLQNKK